MCASRPGILEAKPAHPWSKQTHWGFRNITGMRRGFYAWPRVDRGVENTKKQAAFWIGDPILPDHKLLNIVRAAFRILSRAPLDREIALTFSTARISPQQGSQEKYNEVDQGSRLANSYRETATTGREHNPRQARSEDTILRTRHQGRASPRPVSVSSSVSTLSRKTPAANGVQQM